MQCNQTCPRDTYEQTYDNFKNNPVDISRAPSRYCISVLEQSVCAPLLYRHYVHHHNDISGFSGYAPVSLSFCTLYLFKKGKPGFLMDSRLYKPGYGEIIVLPPDRIHSVFYYALEELDYYEIDFPQEFFTMLPESSPFRRLFFPAQEVPKPLLCLNRQDTGQLFRLLEECDNLIRHPDSNTDYALYSLFIRLAILTVGARELESNTKTERRIPPTLETALKYISENYLTIQDTKQIAEHCHISVSYLCRIFKRSLGTTPIAYINSQKLSRAKELLRNGCNVTEACYASGFNSYNYFIAIFRKTMGLTPDEYRKQK